MDNNFIIIICIVVIAIGTFLTRATPFIFNIENILGERRKESLRKFLYLMGAAIIAALLATSIDFEMALDQKAQKLFSMAGGFIGIVFAHLIYKNSGISVLFGLFSYFMVSTFFS